MTTTVTVTTNDCPAIVRTFPLTNRVPQIGGEWSEGTRVEPHSSQEFVVHDGQDICVGELAKEAEAGGDDGAKG